MRKAFFIMIRHICVSWYVFTQGNSCWVEPKTVTLGEYSRKSHVKESRYTCPQMAPTGGWNHTLVLISPTHYLQNYPVWMLMQQIISWIFYILCVNYLNSSFQLYFHGGDLYFDWFIGDAYTQNRICLQRNQWQNHIIWWHAKFSRDSFVELRANNQAISPKSMTYIRFMLVH